jgi:hypothetical protein
MSSYNKRYIGALRSASRENLAHYYAGGKDFDKSVRRASPETRRRLYKESEARIRYLSLADSNRRAREMAARHAANRNIEYVRRIIKQNQALYNAAKAQKWNNTNTRIYAYFPHSKKTLKRVIYHLKQHLKRLEFAKLIASHIKFSAGRKVAERMLPALRLHYYVTSATQRKKT